MKERATRILSDTLTIAVFCGVIALPAVGTVFHWDFYPLQDENRRFSEKPVFAETGLAGYPGAFEAYYGDHFGFRNTFIRRYRKLWPKISGKKDQRVLFGKDNWLYFLSEGVISDFVGAVPFTEKDLAGWQRSVESRTQWLAQRDCAYLFAIAPNKPRVYPEHLPEDILASGKPGRAAELMGYLEKHSETRIVYLREAMLEAKAGGQVYFSNDTHWTDYGTFVAHRALIEHLRSALPGIEPVAPAEVIYTPEPSIGDLGYMTVNPEAYGGIRNRMSLRNPGPLEERPFPLSLEPGEKRHELSLNPPVTLINASGKYRAVIFHDSFGEFGLKTLLPQIFQETTFFRCNSDPEILDEVVAKLNPDIVIDIVVERHLGQKVDEDEPRFMPFP